MLVGIAAGKSSMASGHACGATGRLGDGEGTIAHAFVYSTQQTRALRLPPLATIMVPAESEQM